MAIAMYWGDDLVAIYNEVSSTLPAVAISMTLCTNVIMIWNNERVS